MYYELRETAIDRQRRISRMKERAAFWFAYFLFVMTLLALVNWAFNGPDGSGANNGIQNPQEYYPIPIRGRDSMQEKGDGQQHKQPAQPNSSWKELESCFPQLL